jgi:hypothetical protein
MTYAANSISRRRPRESGDPYAAASRFRAVADGFGFNRLWWLWVPAPRAQLRTRQGRRKRIQSSAAARKHSFAISPRNSREFCSSLGPLQIRGRRECRALDAPAASYAMVESIRVVTTVTPETPGIPRAMVLTASFVLSPVTGLVCHRHRRSCLRRLDSSVGAPGPHDFSVRVHAARRAAHPRPPHPVPRP